MKLTKQMVREAWKNEPGLRDYWAPYNRVDADRYPNCAAIAVGGVSNERDIVPNALWHLWVALNNEGFSYEEGVTPVERRDCFIALLDAGAFDAWLDA